MFYAGKLVHNKLCTNFVLVLGRCGAHSLIGTHAKSKSGVLDPY